MDYEQILYEVEGGVAVVTLNREGTVAFFEKRAPAWTGSVSKEYPEETF